MNNSEELFDIDVVDSICNFVESKEDILKNIKEFNEKDKELSLCMESLENELSIEDKNKFDNIIKLMYQVEEYYIALAYILGKKHGKI